MQLLQLRLDDLELENALSTTKMIKIKLVNAVFRACSTFAVQSIHTFAEKEIVVCPPPHNL